jgi:Pup amidohydrolase
MTALEIQHHYLAGCRRFLAAQPDPPAEASQIIDRWSSVLHDLEHDRERLVGRLDWITKQWLIEKCGADSTWAARKKIDLRYHELSPQGYFEQLRAAGAVREILSEDEIDNACAVPPPNSPATLRGHHIRKLLASGEAVRANWQCVSIGQPPQVSRLWLDA